MTDECSICLENLVCKTLKLKCNHVFHLDCIKQIMNNKCPLCREKIINKSICDSNHLSYFYSSTYNKKGKCMVCYGYSFKHLINNMVKD